MAANVPVIVLDGEDDEDVQITVVVARHGVASESDSALTHTSESAAIRHDAAAGPAFGSPLQAGAARAGTNYMTPGSFDWLVEATYSPGCQEFRDIPETTAPPVTRTPERSLPPVAEQGQAAMANKSNLNPHPTAQEQHAGAITPFTAAFFKDMADQIASIFPYQEFAALHGCTVEDVNRALMDTVLGPLVGHSSPFGTQVETGSGCQIKKWDAQYQDMAHVLQAGREGSAHQGATERAAAAGPHIERLEDTNDAAIDAQSDANPTPAVDPRLVDPQLTNGTHHVPAATPASAGSNMQSANDSDEASSSRKRSRDESEITPVASTGMPTEPLPTSFSKRTKKGPTTTTTTFLDPPIAALADKLATSVSEHLAAVSAARGDQQTPRVHEDGRLRYPEISRRKRVVVDAFGSYVTAPVDRGSSPEFYPYLDDAQDSSSGRLPRLPTPGPK